MKPNAIIEKLLLSANRKAKQFHKALLSGSSKTVPLAMIEQLVEVDGTVIEHQKDGSIIAYLETPVWHFKPIPSGELEGAFIAHDVAASTPNIPKLSGPKGAQRK